MGFAAQRDVFCGRKIGNDIEFLENNTDSHAPGSLRIKVFYLLTVYKNRSFIRFFGAGQYLHQCRFAGAVFSNNSMNLSFPDLQADRIKRLNPGKAFGEIIYFQNRIFLHAKPIINPIIA
jgi:hypothetical protein